METRKKERMKAIKVMHNDDVAILDYLADLKDRKPIYGLQKFLDYSQRKPVCLLHNCPEDNRIVLILYKAPLNFNEEPNNLTLFVYDSLAGLKIYFEGWLRQVKEGDSTVIGALTDIIGVLDFEIDRDIQRKIALSDLQGK